MYTRMPPLIRNFLFVLKNGTIVHLGTRMIVPRSVSRVIREWALGLEMAL